jgi:hypothetical protein
MTAHVLYGGGGQGRPDSRGAVCGGYGKVCVPSSTSLREHAEANQLALEVNRHASVLDLRSPVEGQEDMLAEGRVTIGGGDATDEARQL